MTCLLNDVHLSVSDVVFFLFSSMPQKKTRGTFLGLSEERQQPYEQRLPYRGFFILGLERGDPTMLHGQQKLERGSIFSTTILEDPNEQAL